MRRLSKVLTQGFLEETGLFVGTAVALAAGAVWSLSLILGGSAGPGHLVLAFSILATTVVGTLGMVLSRGQWSRRFTQIVMSSLVVLAAFTRPGWWPAGVVLALVALAISSTQWGRNGLRKLTPAAAIPDQAVVLPLLLLGLPAIVGVGQLDEAGIGLVVWTGIVIAMALFYSRASYIGLWAIRVGLTLISIPIVLTSPLLAGVVTTLAVAAVVALAWHPQAMAAIVDAAPRLVDPVPVPPELVPENLMNAAGYDSSGRPLNEAGNE